MATQQPEIISITLHLQPNVQRALTQHAQRARVSPEEYCRRTCLPAIEAAIEHPLASASFLTLRSVVVGNFLFSPEGYAALLHLATQQQTSAKAFCTALCLTALEQATGESNTTGGSLE